MIIKKWEDLPENMKIEEVKKYYYILSKKRYQLLIKRIFDIIVSGLMLSIVSPLLLLIAIAIKLDSKGPVFYRQVRLTTYGKEFRIHKFRTMIANADKVGTQVTVGNDSRVTRIGSFLRRFRIDEIPQLIDILVGDMSFVGPRPEVPKYVDKYSNEMKATLLVPAGVTSEASIQYKDEAELLDNADDVDRVYVDVILPGKMKYNLKSLKEFSFFREIITMFRTILAVLGFVK